MCTGLPGEHVWVGDLSWFVVFQFSGIWPHRSVYGGPDTFNWNVYRLVCCNHLLLISVKRNISADVNNSFHVVRFIFCKLIANHLFQLFVWLSNFMQVVLFSSTWKCEILTGHDLWNFEWLTNQSAILIWCFFFSPQPNSLDCLKEQLVVHPQPKHNSLFLQMWGKKDNQQRSAIFSQIKTLC